MRSSIPERRSLLHELTTDTRVKLQFEQHRRNQVDKKPEALFRTNELEPTNSVERSLLIDTWKHFFKTDQQFTGVHFGIFTENMIRILGGRNDAGYRESKLYLSGNHNSEITLRWHPASKHSPIPGGHASVELINADEPVADRIEYGEDLRGDTTAKRPVRIREFILPDKYRSPSTGDMVDNRQRRVLIQAPEPFHFATDGKELAMRLLGFVEIARIPV